VRQQQQQQRDGVRVQEPEGRGQQRQQPFTLAPSPPAPWAGEYADRIDNAGELLQTFLDSFHDETTTVQLQLLTATVKLFLKRPADSETLVQSVLSMATEHSDNPDLRDRGYIYWRLLSTDPDAAKAVVLADRPVIQVRGG
jgi:vesicle coat complex subunit